MNNVDIQTLKKLKGATGKERVKSKSKQIGVKSTFVMGNNVAISSFAEVKNGKGKKVPNVEIISSKDGNETYRENFKLLKHVDVDPDTVRLDGMIGSTEIENPAKSFAKGDYVGIKSALEKKYFGREFPEDNVHVQIAYNIADIKKHITLFINQIIYTFYNVNRALTDRKFEDVIGTLYAFADLDNQTFKNESALYLLEGVKFYDSYFPGVFRLPERDKNGNISDEEKRKCDNNNFNILRLISLIRQFCGHETIGRGNADSYLYDIKNSLSGNPDLLDQLDLSYASVINRINKGFDLSSDKKTKATSANNLFILSKILTNENERSLVEKYYRYTVFKEQNNIGVNLKLLREIIIENRLKDLRNKEYDTYRSKVNTILGFIIYDFLKDSDLLAETVAKLRANSGEDGRLFVYSDLAEKIWSKIGNTLIRAVTEIKKEANNKFKSDFKISFSVENEVYSIKNYQGDYFTKMINLMTKFLDGKEINELLTGLISRFRNIADLTTSARECGVLIEFAPTYRIFAKADTIADELSLVKSVARMKPEMRSIKNNVILDAAEILGVSDVVANSLSLDKEEKAIAKGSKFLERIYSKDKQGKLNSPLRNFIINNVVKSRWFFYIARYTKPEVCRKIISNEKLVGFVLAEIPDEQIFRYYKAVTGYTTSDAASSRGYLAKRLHNFSIDKVFDEIEKLDKREYASQREGATKQKNQAIIGLYLTVAYLFVKNMVKTNAVFSIAFSCLERDIALLNGEKNSYITLTKSVILRDCELVEKYNAIRNSIRDNSSISVEEKRDEYKSLKPIATEMHNTLHGYYYVNSNLQNAVKLLQIEPRIIHEYRNIVMHLAVPAEMVKYLSDIQSVSSYYAIYVYCLQRSVLQECKNYAKRGKVNFLTKQNNFINTSGRYSAHLLWILNVPFAYNMARYKNLSIEELFCGKPVKKKESMPNITVEGVATKIQSKSSPNVSKSSGTGTEYSAGDVVQMERIEATARGGIRGYVKDTDIKLTISPATVKATGISSSDFMRDFLNVSIVAWDNGACAYNVVVSELVVAKPTMRGEYNVGDVVTMSNVERTRNGKIRGVVKGTQIKITIPKSEMLGRSALDFVGKDIEVELLRWDSNANAYNAKPKT